MCKKMGWEKTWENELYTFLGGTVTDFLPIQWKDAPGKKVGKMIFMPFSAEATPSNSMEGRSGEKSWENDFSPF